MKNPKVFIVTTDMLEIFLIKLAGSNRKLAMPPLVHRTHIMSGTTTNIEWLVVTEDE